MNIGINVQRFELEESDHGVGCYYFGSGRWAEILMYNGEPIATIWNKKQQTVKTFKRLSARLVAVKALEIGRQIDELPGWCGSLLMKRNMLLEAILEKKL